MSCVLGKFSVALVKETKAITNSKIYRITKEFICGRKYFDAPVKDINSRIVTRAYEQLKRRKEHFIRIFNCITFSEIQVAWMWMEVKSPGNHRVV